MNDYTKVTVTKNSLKNRMADEGLDSEKLVANFLKMM